MFSGSSICIYDHMCFLNFLSLLGCGACTRAAWIKHYVLSSAEYAGTALVCQIWIMVGHTRGGFVHWIR